MRKSIARLLRREPLPILLAEAGWRIYRAVRRRIWLLTRQRAPQVHFHPVGYYLSHAEVDPRSIVAYADAVLQGEYPMMGYGSPQLGSDPDWQCDWVSGRKWPFKDSAKVQIVRYDGSDVKAPWELSRLQFAPVVAHAWALTGDRKYRDRIKSLLTCWVANNPVEKGVNWTVAMEAALRGISICLTLERLSPFSDEEKPWLRQITASLWQHLRFIEAHSEFSFRVRSNHYLSNLAGLTSLSAWLDSRGMSSKFKKYARRMQREVLRQTYDDGGDREASTGYHLLVTQMALHSYAVMQRRGLRILPAFEARLLLMLRWVSTLADASGRLPMLGDCDNGRVELLPDDVAQALEPATQRHSLRTASLQRNAARLLPVLEPVSLLSNSGLAVLRAGEASAVFAAMPNGLAGRGSHTHCDKLSIVFRLGSQEVFCDSGSRSYTRSPGLRNLDRSTAAHSTLTIDGQDQNTIPQDRRLLFASGDEARVSPITSDELRVCASHFGYTRMGVVHHRTVHLAEGSLTLTDDVSGAGKHTLDLRFILAPEWLATPALTKGPTVSCGITGSRTITLTCEGHSHLSLSVQPAKVSREFGTAIASGCILIHTTVTLPTTIQTRVDWNRAHE